MGNKGGQGGRVWGSVSKSSFRSSVIFHSVNFYLFIFFLLFFFYIYILLGSFFSIISLNTMYWYLSFNTVIWQTL